MNKQFIEVIKKIKSIHGEDIFKNRSRFNAILADYTAGKYKGECNLINVALSEGLYDELKNDPNNLNQIKGRYRTKFKSIYFWNDETTDFIIDTLAIISESALLNNPYSYEQANETEQVLEINKATNPLENQEDNITTSSAKELFKIGLDYFEGINDKKRNYTKAVELFNKAATQGYAAAQYYLGLCYKKGYSVWINEKQEAIWFTMAAEQGHADSQNQLGLCYKNGEGVNQDYSQAIKWFKKAADQGNVDAKTNLNTCPKELKTQVHTVSQYLNQMDGIYEYGKCYFYGLGVEIDYNRAGVFWEKAAANGNKDAERDLKMLKKNEFGKYVKNKFY